MQVIKLFFLSAILLFTQNILAQNPENWTSKQLMAPAALAHALQAGKHVPVIISVGPGAVIPHSIDIGMVRDKENLDKLKKELAALPRDTSVVIYCGCCPFEHCPNVRPAIAALKELKFTNYRLLNLSNNIKVDWIGKGFPTVK